MIQYTTLLQVHVELQIIVTPCKMQALHLIQNSSILGIALCYIHAINK